MPCRLRLVLARSLQLFTRIDAGRLEHPIARRFAGGFGQDERFVDERRQQVEGVQVVEIRAAADGDRALERKAVNEDAEAPEQRSLALVEQIVAPIDEGPQRLLPW